MRPEPLRFSIARRFLESARDMGDTNMIACAVRVWESVNFPRSKPMAADDRAIYLAWQEEA